MITLHAARLTFVILGQPGKVHARDSHLSAVVTCCGRHVPDGIGSMPERSQRIARVCGHCIASLRTYGGGQVTIEAE